MPTNRDLEAAWSYHNRTKHSYESVRTSTHFLDWANQPRPFKIYPTLQPLLLPRELPQTGVAALSALARGQVAREEAAPDLERLAHLLYFSAGITRRRAFPGGEIFFRAAACTGALYEIELYVVCADLLGLAAGIYHFSVADFALRPLRAGDYRGLLAQATGGEPAIAHAPAVIICTGTYWRNAWKYRERTYRHFGWDNGTLLANLLTACAAWGLPARVVGGFVDAEVNRLLDVDPQREVAFSLVPVGYRAASSPEAPKEISPLGLETVPLSAKEVDYPAMRALHDASSLPSAEEVARWRGSRPASPSRATEPPAPQGATAPLAPLEEAEQPRDPLERVILRRGSARKFAPEPISFAQLSTLLGLATDGLEADFLQAFGAQLNDLYLVAHAVEGLAAGAYFFNRQRRQLECLKEGQFRQQAYSLGLEQELPAEASVAVFFLADLGSILERYGNRGYRAVQLEAGILGGKLYLAAYALGLAATGLTFYDDDVVEFFSPHARGKSAIFLTALGRRPRR